VNRLPRFLAYLELTQDADEPAIKRAYARKLKQIDQEADPAGFQALREAYEAALHWSRRDAEGLPDEAPEHLPDEAPEDLPDQAREDLPDEAEDIVREPRPVPAPQPQEPARADAPEIVAQAVLSELAAALIAHADDYDAVRQRFLLAVDDPRLIRIEAKDMFEWCVAEHLAAGWRPGSECLLAIAIQHFDWRDDPRRLSRFGRVGAMLDRATGELKVFDMGVGKPGEPDQATQKEFLRRLRSDLRPGSAALVKGLPVLESLETRYPVLFPLITKARNLERWRRWMAELPFWRRELAGLWTVFQSFGGFFVMLGILGGVAYLLTAGSRPASTPFGRYASPPAASSPAPASMPASHNERLLSGPEATRVAAAVVGPPTAQKCEDAARIEQAYAASSYERNPGLGQSFDRRIVECASAGLWPTAAQSDPAVEAAMAREALRSTASR